MAETIHTLHNADAALTACEESVADMRDTLRTIYRLGLENVAAPERNLLVLIAGDLKAAAGDLEFFVKGLQGTTQNSLNCTDKFTVPKGQE